MGGRAEGPSRKGVDGHLPACLPILALCRFGGYPGQVELMEVTTRTQTCMPHEYLQNVADLSIAYTCYSFRAAMPCPSSSNVILQVLECNETYQVSR